MTEDGNDKINPYDLDHDAATTYFVNRIRLSGRYRKIQERVNRAFDFINERSETGIISKGEANKSTLKIFDAWIEANSYLADGGSKKALKGETLLESLRQRFADTAGIDLSAGQDEHV